MLRRTLALALLLALAGCLQAPSNSTATGDEKWHVLGTFTQGYTDADVRAVCEALVGTPTCELALSDPPQFGGHFPTRAACDDARARLHEIPHVRVEACRDVGGSR